MNNDNSTIKAIDKHTLGLYVLHNHAKFYPGKSTAFLFSFSIASFCYDETKGYVSILQSDLSKTMNVSVRQVRRYFKDMLQAVDDSGKPLWIVKSANENGGYGRSNHYIPNFIDQIDATNTNVEN